MYKNYLKLILMLGPGLLLLLWVGVLSYRLHSGTEVILRIKGYDPRSLLSGHYIQYMIDWDNSDCTQFANGVCPEEEFRKALSDGRWGRNGRFYISEEEADALDKAVRDESNKAEIVYSYRIGRQPYALRLLINGQKFEAKKQRR